jgi:hypothetical protein
VCTNLSDLLLLLPNLLTSSLVNEKKAVSVAEKKAEKQSRDNINRACGRQFNNNVCKLSSSNNVTSYGKWLALLKNHHKIKRLK